MWKRNIHRMWKKHTYTGEKNIHTQRKLPASYLVRGTTWEENPPTNTRRERSMREGGILKKKACEVLCYNVSSIIFHHSFHAGSCNILYICALCSFLCISLQKERKETKDPAWGHACLDNVARIRHTWVRPFLYTWLV